MVENILKEEDIMMDNGKIIKKMEKEKNMTKMVN